MNKDSHRKITFQAVEILEEMGVTIPDGAKFGRVNLAASAVEADYLQDLEFVDVDGSIDDPHSDQGFWTNDDECHYSYDGRNFTSFSHFIDIKKGPGIFDDYDGYAYHKGSASKDQYQDASDLIKRDSIKNIFASIFADIGDYQVDEGINWWFNDEYVHAPGHTWYNNCSPSLLRYSFPEDKGIYHSKEEELAARFAQEKRKGVPHSVFMPVDNMARYWFGQYLKTEDICALGYVMHAIQDASVPHHASGYMGNWHADYEHELDIRISDWLNQENFTASAKDLVRQWYRQDPNPPFSLQLDDRNRVPAINWRIDMLVTWLALNAYQEYAATYNNFQNGFQVNEPSMRTLAIKALAMSALILIKAREESQEKNFIEGSTNWVRYREHVASVIIGYDSIEGVDLIYAVDSNSGNIFQYNGQPNSWKEIGGPGKKFVVANGRLYGLSPDGSGIYLYSGSPGQWDRIGGASVDIYGGLAGLFAINPETQNIHSYQDGQWDKIGGPGKMFAVGSQLYGLSLDGNGIYRYENSENKWRRIGDQAKAIYSIGDKVYAELLPNGNFSVYIPDSSRWMPIGGPGDMFAVGHGENVVGLSPGGRGIYKYRGFPGKWKRVADKAQSIYATSNYILALAHPAGIHRNNDHQLWFLKIA